jgi:hypothetical protein
MKAALWDARSRGDLDAETHVNLELQELLPRLEKVVMG